MRKKANKADELYIKENAAKSAEEISQEIDLNVTTVATILKEFKKTSTNRIVKQSRLKANGQNIGSFLSNEIADYVPTKKEPKEQSHLYKSKKKD